MSWTVVRRGQRRSVKQVEVSDCSWGEGNDRRRAKGGRIRMGTMTEMRVQWLAIGKTLFCEAG